jgi:hypothetical protein
MSIARASFGMDPCIGSAYEWKWILVFLSVYKTRKLFIAA